MCDNPSVNNLVTENLGLVHSCANRFRGRGIEYDDLFQAGCLGLVKAASGFNPDLGFRFSTYAVPAILGEIKRLFRDGGTVKIGRAAKDRARQLLAVRESLIAKNSKEPSVSEISSAAGIEPTEAAALLSACLPVISLTPEEDGTAPEIPVQSSADSIIDSLSLSSALDTLDEDEKKLITCRYYKELTQSETAKLLGISQVQVSRKEKNILLKLRKILT